ncbi:DUF72 domain-containing protein [Variovorax sp. PAMC 28711]|uniref:DUF72 domain-containing protein n=1 Tax=Variovorax sp. PAMC 28711 TaxID=1795631 RepID=UPI00078CB72E|nr:DUF72 domain-containing protein [Variovorax sp. PAMC 28711]AMM26336.1 hypothetical protein AX767_19755 [Variovorax sp. PAMC 28711]
MQDSLFDDLAPVPAAVKPTAKVAAGTAAKSGTAGGAKVQPAAPRETQRALAGTLPPSVRMGTSSWFFPGWKGLVWDGDYAQSVLSKHGLAAYAQHPLLRTVSLDRTFYRPISASQFAAYAAQVPDDFRFVVKAPSLVSAAMVRGEDGRGQQPNPAFLDPVLAVEQFVQPALDGLGHKLGALVFQLSPLPGPMLARLPELLERLRTMLRALPVLKPLAPDGVIAVEVRNPEFLTTAFAEVLRESGATYCLGLHAKMPPVGEQLPMLRALWPGPMVCRWSLHRRHGAYGYENAKASYAPFDRIVDEDAESREVLARVIVATAAAGHTVYLTVNNKAEGSAPLSVEALARAVAEKLG